MKTRILKADLDNSIHADAILAILDSYAKEPVGGGKPLPSEVKNRLIPELKKRDNALILLAMQEDAAIGVAVCFVGFSTFSARPLVNVHDLAVLPEFRGQGTGHLLLESLDAHAAKLGCCKITLEVREDNAGARALYKRFGYNDYNPADKAVTTFFLEKRL